MQKNHKILVLLFCISLAISAIQPHDYFTWILEVFPAIIGVIILVATYSKFKFTNLTYNFILVHCLILFIGGHYTYAEVPAFNWLKEVMHSARNNYDKVGHFAQGFVPAFIIRELFVRKAIVKQGAWLNVLTVCMCLSISVCYEFLEWFVALATGESADSFLGTQGYIWDTQSDMLYAGIGACTMLLLFTKTQNNSIKNLV